MPNSSAYQRFAAARSAAQKLTVVSPRNIGAPFVAATATTVPGTHDNADGTWFSDLGVAVPNGGDSTGMR
jgi:hypothetical protein